MLLTFSAIHLPYVMSVKNTYNWNLKESQSNDPPPFRAPEAQYRLTGSVFMAPVRTTMFVSHLQPELCPNTGERANTEQTAGGL